MRKRTRIVIVAVAALLAIPMMAIAADRFNDVPDTNIFHDDIAWLADAGVTAGCNPPANDEFCPEDAVKRQQMAAFMRRFAQYLGAEDGIVSEADNADTLDGLDSTEFQQVPTDTQYLVIAGSGMIDEDSTNHTSPYFVGSGGDQACIAPDGRAYANVNLPNGAVVTEVAFNYGDDGAILTDNGIGYLTQMPLVGSTGLYDDIFTADLVDATPGEMASVVDSTPISSVDSTIDNSSFAYTIIADTYSADAAICAAVISYTVAPGFDSASLTTDTTGGTSSRR